MTEQNLTTPKEIHKIIKKLGNKKAPGEDAIRNTAIKNLPQKAILKLYYILNACLKMSYFPSNWKNAMVIPLLKPGKNPKDPNSYRPISLLPCLSKILERIILDRIQNHIIENKILIDEQHGFRANCSTVLQLARLTNIITTNFNLNKITAVLTLDVEKAFDTVWHNGLIHKLLTLKFPIYITKFVQSYLNNRSFQVKIDHTLSNHKILPAGVLQGAVLSPTLFILYINDIPKTDNTKIALFADDTALIAESWQARTADRYLQRHINLLEPYFNKWKIKINADKTQITYFTKKNLGNHRTNLQMSNTNLESTKSVKYLGVHLDNRLTYNLHIKNTLIKAQKSFMALLPLITITSPLELDIKLYVYKQYIRPILLYGCPIFSSTSKSNIHKMQIFQNKILRLILRKRKRTKISVLHKESNIHPIVDKCYEIAQKFFHHTTKCNSLTESITLLNKENAPFKIKHKLSHNIVFN